MRRRYYGNIATPPPPPPGEPSGIYSVRDAFNPSLPTYRDGTPIASGAGSWYERFWYALDNWEAPGGVPYGIPAMTRDNPNGIANSYELMRYVLPWAITCLAYFAVTGDRRIIAKFREVWGWLWGNKQTAWIGTGNANTRTNQAGTCNRQSNDKIALWIQGSNSAEPNLWGADTHTFENIGVKELVGIIALLCEANRADHASNGTVSDQIRGFEQADRAVWASYYACKTTPKEYVPFSDDGHWHIIAHHMARLRVWEAYYRTYGDTSEASAHLALCQNYENAWLSTAYTPGTPGGVYYHDWPSGTGIVANYGIVKGMSSYSYVAPAGIYWVEGCTSLVHILLHGGLSETVMSQLARTTRHGLLGRVSVGSLSNAATSFYDDIAQNSGITAYRPDGSSFTLPGTSFRDNQTTGGLLAYHGWPLLGAWGSGYDGDGKGTFAEYVTKIYDLQGWGNSAKGVTIPGAKLFADGWAHRDAGA